MDIANRQLRELLLGLFARLLLGLCFNRQYDLLSRAGLLLRAGSLSLILCYGGVVFLDASYAQQDQSVNVGVDQVRMIDASNHIKLLGTIVTRKEVSIAASINGPVASIDVNVGDRLQKGDVVGVLASDLLHANVDLAQARFNQAKAAVKTQERRIELETQKLVRLDKLRGSVSFSQAVFEDQEKEIATMQSALIEAQANLQATQATLAIATINVERTTIRAPFAGVITAKHIDVGAYASVGTQIVSMLDDRNVEIATDVPAKLVASLRANSNVSVVFSNEQVGTARVRAFSASETLTTRTRRIWFEPIEDQQWPKAIAVNQSVDVEIPGLTAGKQLTISKDAVLVRSGLKTAFAIVDGKAQPRNLVLDDGSVQGRFIVLSGVQEGEQVIVKGNERLRPGQSVSVKP